LASLEANGGLQLHGIVVFDDRANSKQFIQDRPVRYVASIFFHETGKRTARAGDRQALRLAVPVGELSICSPTSNDPPYRRLIDMH